MYVYVVCVIRWCFLTTDLFSLFQFVLLFVFHFNKPLIILVDCAVYNRGAVSARGN